MDGGSLACMVIPCPNCLGLMVLLKFLTIGGWHALLAGTLSPGPLAYSLLKKREEAWDRSHFVVTCGTVTGNKTKNDESTCPHVWPHKALRDETHSTFLSFLK